MMYFCEQSPFLEMIDVSYCALNEHNCTPPVCSAGKLLLLDAEGNSLIHKGAFVLSEFCILPLSYRVCNKLSDTHTPYFIALFFLNVLFGWVWEEKLVLGLCGCCVLKSAF